MRTNLQLNGWPPLASHIAALFCGAISVHLFSFNRQVAYQIPENHVVFSLRSESFLDLEDAQKLLGEQVLFAKRQDQSVCAIHPTPALLMEISPSFVFAVPWAKFMRLGGDFIPRKQSNIKLVDVQKRIPSCVTQEYVEYGKDF